VNGVFAAGLPTVSQIQGWQTDHLSAAAKRWKMAADTWTTVYGEIAEALPAPHGTVWQGDASQAAQARMTNDRTSVQALAERLRAGSQVAESGGNAVNAAKREVLLVIGMANTMGFEVRDDLSVVDRMVGLPLPARQLRRQQANLLATNVRMGAAQLAAVDQLVARDINRATPGFDAVDFSRSPIVGPVATDDAERGFGQCFSENFKEDLGRNMVQGVFVGGALGALRGAVVGLFGGPVGVLGGTVLGFVGGAASGAMISGPVRTAATSAWDCR
jgi:uncharacterized protein YukE